MRELWIASNNEKKRAELQRLLGTLGYTLRVQSEAPDAIEVVEDAPDFAGNAALKAIALARTVGAHALGDDSGLCVDALDGRPGVLSARYGGAACKTDEDRSARLLDELGDRPLQERTARFVCHICLAAPDGSVLARFEESCPGVITAAPRGASGFGYDPVFISDHHRDRPGSPTFAELSAADKDAVSHRGKALRQLVAHLEQHPLT